MSDTRASEDSKARILVIDDSRTAIALVQSVLEAAGYEVSVAMDGEAGIKKLSIAHPDLILLDISMPVIDGFETCKRIRGTKEGREIPIIFLSGLTSGADKAKAFGIGGSDYMTKPMDSTEILARVKAHLAKSVLDRRERQLNEELERRIDERTAEIRRVLEERTLLLGEINHRVMNNLQIFTALAEQQLVIALEDETKRVLHALQERANAMALVYSCMAQSGDLSSIDAAEFIAELAGMYADAKHSRIVTDLVPVRIDVTRAVAFGLIASELIVNGKDHAYKGMAGTHDIRVRLRVEGDCVELRVEDDGKGYDHAATREAGTVGLNLVQILTDQLGGTYSVQGPPGTSAWLVFRIPVPSSVDSV